MASPILHQLAAVHCAHDGQAQPAQASGRVLVEGKPVVLVDTPWIVGGCTLAAPRTCASARFVTASTRILVTGRPVVLGDSTSVTAPSGGALIVMTMQHRVVAS